MTIISTLTPASRQTVALFHAITADVLAGLTALAAFLLDRGYDLHRRGKVLQYAAREGTLEGCEALDSRHSATAEAAFVDGMTAVALDDPAWGSPTGSESPEVPLDDCWTPNDATLRVDVAELIHGDEEFESWLSSVDAAGFPPMFESIA